MFSSLSTTLLAAIPLTTISEWTEGILEGTTPLLIYVTLFLFVFIETGILIAFFLPGDSVLFAAGFIAAIREDTSITILVTVIFLAAFIGDQVGFLLGRHFGRPYIDKYKAPKIRKMIARAERFYEKYGYAAIILARFYPWIRTIAPPLAGIGKMNYFKFLSANIIGAFLWGVGITMLGYYAASIPILEESSHWIAAFFIVLTVALTIRNYNKAKRDERSASDERLSE
jgi:membrane-associated protein